MADNSGEKGEKGFAKMLSKQMARTKEKVMKKIKHEDRTTDGEFDRAVECFNQQQAVANQLLKEFKTYLINVKAMAMASQNMYQTIRDSYERTWSNADEFVLASENLISSWDVYCAKLNDSVCPLLSDYINKFRDVKAKVAKRGRKLTDFDSSRRNVDSLENAKKRDEAKISKAHEEFNAAKLVYESIHSELCEELPILYQSRVSSLCSYFGALFQAEAQFDDECSKVKTSLEKLVEVPVEEVESSVETPDRSHMATPCSASTPPPRPRPSISNSVASIEERQRAASEADSGPDPNEYITLVGGSDEIDSESSDPEDQETYASCSAKSASRSRGGARGTPDKNLNQVLKSSSSSDSDDLTPKDRQRSGDGCKVKSQRSVDAKKNGMKDGRKSSPKRGVGDEGSLNEDGKLSSGAAESKLSKDISGNNPIPSDKESAILTVPVPENADNYLFQVVAIHDYKAVGSNELSFEKGDIIHVLPEEEVFTGQDENWIFGVKHATGEKGTFPLNFTSKM